MEMQGRHSLQRPSWSIRKLRYPRWAYLLVGLSSETMFQMLSLKQGRPGRRRHLRGFTFSADGTDPTVENGKLTIDVFAADGDDDVAAFSACEITIAGDALAAIQASNELVVTTCDDGSTFQIPQGVSFARVSFEDALGNPNVL